MTRSLTPPQPSFSAAPISVAPTPRKPRPLDAGTAPQVAVRESLGYHNNPDMVVCPLVEDFLKHYGPSKSPTELDFDVDSCFAEVTARRLAERCEGERYRWTEYKKLPRTGKPQESSEAVEKVSCNPSGLKLDEPQTFQPLQEIVDCVLMFVQKDGQQETGMHFELVPNTKLTGDIYGSNHKIDACFIAEPLADKKKAVANRNINVPMEFKKKRHIKDRAIVHSQILGACHHILNEDIRRMWIYGLTLEDNLCSLWYFSRSHSVKSKAFDWIKEPKRFVRVLLAFAKATPRELGIDPTVHLVLESEDEAASFVYEVPAKDKDGNNIVLYYKTLGVIFESRPMAISGRMTRIWKVVEVKDATGKERVESAEEMVLKDVWLSKDRATEAQNLDKIFAAVDEYVKTGLEEQKRDHPDWDDEKCLKHLIEQDPRFGSFNQQSRDRLCANLTNKAYRNLFLSKVHHWQGEICKGVGESVWRDYNFFSRADRASDYPDPTESQGPQSTENQEPQPGKKTKNAKSTTSKKPKNMDPYSTNRPSATPDGTQPKWGQRHQGEFLVEKGPRSFAPKQQSRFIYREVCTTLQNLDTLGEVVDVLCQVMDVMHILFLAGWVHRDISSSNIMAYRSNATEKWTVKLADFEFSRLMVDPTRQANVDPRTGTPYFIPVEVHMGQYLLGYFRKDSPSDNSAPLDGSRPFAQLPDNNLAVQLNASTMGEDYVDNLKHYKAFPSQVNLTDIQLKPQWADVPKESVTVNHNYQHDLESIWWIFVWIITCRVGHEPSARAMGEYFDNNMKNSKARSALLQAFPSGNIAGLREEIMPLWPVLDHLRQLMHTACLMRAVLGHLNIPESYSSIQAKFSEYLHAMQAHDGAWRDIRLHHGTDPQIRESIASTQTSSATTGKREREDSAEDDDPFAEDQNAQKRIRQTLDTN